MQRIGRRRLEVEMLVESARLFILGVDQDGADTDFPCRTRRAKESVLEQRGPEALPLLTLIHGQAGEENHGDGVPHQALPDPLGRFALFNAAGRKRVVPDHAAIPADDEHTRGPGPMIDQGVSAEPVCQFGLAAVERGRIVSISEGFNAGERVHPSRARPASSTACAGAASSLPGDPGP